MAHPKHALTEPPRKWGETKTAVPKCGQKRAVFERQRYWNAKSSRLEGQKQPKNRAYGACASGNAKKQSGAGTNHAEQHKTESAVAKNGQERKNNAKSGTHEPAGENTLT